MAHETNPTAEALLDERFPVLDHGFVQLVDYMGGDRRIAEAAWIGSMDEVEAEKKTDAAVRRIIFYMLGHAHTCYDDKTEVLTDRGFIPFRCLRKEIETRVGVWDRERKTLKYEVPKRVVHQPYAGKMYRVEHGGVDLLVTPNHNMFVAKRVWNQGVGRSTWGGYNLIRAEELNHDTMVRYMKVAPLRDDMGFDAVSESGIQTDSREALLRLFGFFIGDGGIGSRNVITFNLRKRHKIEWLAEVAEELGPCWRFYQQPNGCCCLAYDNIGHYFEELFYEGRDKCVPNLLRHMLQEDSLALLDGLKNSDGSIKRGAWQYSTSVRAVADHVQIVALHAGLAAHVHASDGMYTVMMLSRMHHPVVNQSRWNTSWENYDGMVHCAETSTGVLVVRRNGKIVLGGNSPFEQVVLTFRCKMPIFVARQWVRHRTARLNEMSGRYRILPNEMYRPPKARLGGKGISNKQGTEGELTDELCERIIDRFIDDQREDRKSYEWLSGTGLANELARINLPLSQYTEWYWQIDLHNLFHFLKLRLDAHAQWEIRQYAERLAACAKAVAPIAWAAFLKHKLGAVTFSMSEMQMLLEILGQLPSLHQRMYHQLGEHWTPKKVDELYTKLRAAAEDDLNA